MNKKIFCIEKEKYSKTSDSLNTLIVRKSKIIEGSQLQILSNKSNVWAATWPNQQIDCAPSEDSDQPGHPPSLIRVFAVHMKKAWVLSYPLSAQRRLWSDLDAQADLSLRWAHTHFVGFVMLRLNCLCNLSENNFIHYFLEYCLNQFVLKSNTY